MLGRFVLSLLTVGMAVALTLRTPSDSVRAGAIDPLQDSDDDFLPDCVEWAVLTSATNPDTDADNIPDFVEVVQRGTPRLAGSALPMDQEMRIVITGPQGSSSGPTWMHLLLRLAEPTTQLTSFHAWIEFGMLPGLQIGFDMFALGPAVLRQRNAGAEGIWITYSVPLVSAAVVHQVLPCSVQAEAVIGGRYLRSGVNLFDVQGSIATLAPFGQDSYAVQTIAPMQGGGGSSNRVCVVTFQECGTGPGGTVYEVTHADCEDCNELECVLASCAQSLGWLINIPGGLGVMGPN
jgi:hypothetical protein